MSRALDFHFGRAFLWVFGRCRAPRSRRLDASATIALCVLTTIGDALLAGAVLGDLKERYPGARLIMVVSKGNSGIVPLIKYCDECLVLPMFSPLRAIMLMRQKRFDLIIDANPWLRISAIYCALAGARHTVGFLTPGQYRHYAFDTVAVHSNERHELDNYRTLLASIGIVGKNPPFLEITPRHSYPELVSLPPSPFVVFHPWAGGSNGWLREWPNIHWIEIGERLTARGYSIVITGASSDIKKTVLLIDAARSINVPMMMMAGQLNLVQTAVLLRAAALVVSVNTSVMHMAAALNVPLVALHGPTNPKRWGPISANAVSLLPDPVPPGVRVGYLNLGFEFPDGVQPCMEFIRVERVLEAIETALERGQSHHAGDGMDPLSAF